MRTLRCPGCGKEIEEAFAACPLCQAPMPRLDRGPVFIALFLGLGALAAPALWRSPAFTPREKLWYTVLAVVYSSLMIAILVVVVRAFWGLYHDMLRSM